MCIVRWLRCMCDQFLFLFLIQFKWWWWEDEILEIFSSFHLLDYYFAFPISIFTPTKPLHYVIECFRSVRNSIISMVYLRFKESSALSHLSFESLEKIWIIIQTWKKATTKPSLISLYSSKFIMKHEMRIFRFNSTYFVSSSYSGFHLFFLFLFL